MSTQLLVDGEGFADLEIVAIEHDILAKDFLELIAARRGWRAEEAFLFIEDEDQPICATELLEIEVAPRNVHHVHRRQSVMVTVRYKNLEKQHEFAPSARVQRVLDWAVGEHGFRIDPTIAPEMELAIHGTEEALSKGAHIGRFVAHHHAELELDLIRGVVPNGC